MNQKGKYIARKREGENYKISLETREMFPLSIIYVKLLEVLQTLIHFHLTMIYQKDLYVII